ncbi:MAG: ATP-dependent Clp protease adaptor ClpS [Chitinophagaceae bacterium]|nr:MAG: ATP-dependent Clp protease adaptor ClpS [Chitinophagaceae bacterium]
MDSEITRKPQQDQDVLLQNEEATDWQLIVWNDEVNTFDWVIKSLVEICHHTMEQAEQCALFVHFKGKYAVKRGDFELLHPMCEALLDRGITATIEECLTV